MIFPSDLQRRIADLPNLTREESAQLTRDTTAFLREELRIHGGLRSDAYPNVYALTDAERHQIALQRLKARPLSRYCYFAKRSLYQWTERFSAFLLKRPQG